MQLPPNEHRLHHHYAGQTAQRRPRKPRRPRAQPPTPESRFLSGILDLLRSEGKAVPIALIGTKVKRPEGVAKLKPFILAHADKLVFDEKAQTVAAKK
jgi:hypothetical protein